MPKRIPLYKTIIDYLMKEVDQGHIVPGGKVPTEEELARLFNVSRITSKRALTELEQEGLLLRIQGKGSFLRKRPLKTDASLRMIAFVLPFESSQEGVVSTIKGATELLQNKDYYVSIHNSRRCPSTERSILRDLVKKGVSGILFYPTANYNLDLLYALYLERFPLVLIDKPYEGIPLSYVASDNVQGGYLATRHLIFAKRKKIAYVSEHPLENLTSVRHRFFGHCKALKEHELFHRDSFYQLILEGRELQQEYQSLVERLLDLGYDGVQGENDLVAIRLLGACRALKVRVPEDLSLVGFDNAYHHLAMEVKLTTIEQDFYTMGKKAAELVLSSLTQGVEFKDVVLPVQLVLGNT